MNKDLNIVISKINALLKEKKFEKIINEINKNFKENIKPPVIQNILGAAKIFKSNVSINDKLSAAQDFKQAYQNDISFVNPLINFIRLSIELDDFEDAHNLAKKHIEKFGYKKEICQGIARACEFFSYTLLLHLPRIDRVRKLFLTTGYQLG